MSRSVKLLILSVLVTVVACDSNDNPIAPNTPRATTLYVDVADSSAYRSISAAVAVAVEGDTILLANGVYSSADDIGIDFQESNLVLRSVAGDPDSCVIRGPGADRVRGLTIAGNQDERTVIEGITFADFYFKEPYFSRGAAVMISRAAPVFRNCVFQGNVTESGGAVYSYHAAASFINCVFRDNRASLKIGEVNDWGGGAVYAVASANQYQSCEFTANGCTGGDINSGVGGGALRLIEDRSAFLGCRFTENSSKNSGGAIRGNGGVLSLSACVFLNNRTENTAGALLLYEVSLHLAHCDFDSNQAGDSGAVVVGAASPSVIERCRFRGNTAQGWAGAVGTVGPVRILDCAFIHNEGGDGGAVAMNNGGERSIADCFFVGNAATRTGGAVYCNSEVQVSIARCVFVGNSADWWGGALALSRSETDVVGCTFASNSAPDGATIWASNDFGSRTNLERCIIVDSQGDMAVSCEPGAVDVVCSDLWGNPAGDFSGGIADAGGQDGNISADPLFQEPHQLDFRLRADSPCADAQNSCGRMGALPEI